MLDNTQGVDTTFHHGANVIVLNPSALVNNGNHNNIVSQTNKRDFFMS